MGKGYVNKAVWDTSGHQALGLYEGWVRMSARSGLFAQLGRIALATAADIYELDRPLGHSVELTARYRCSSFVTLSLGYTQMQGTETMARLKQDGSSSNARWGWLSLTVTPSLFTTKW